jgi:hypothetical protein
VAADFDGPLAKERLYFGERRLRSGGVRLGLSAHGIYLVENEGAERTAVSLIMLTSPRSQSGILGRARVVLGLGKRRKARITTRKSKGALAVKLLRPL